MGETGEPPLTRSLANADQLRSADPEILRLAFQRPTKRRVSR
jgi:hypothetical protein